MGTISTKLKAGLASASIGALTLIAAAGAPAAQASASGPDYRFSVT